MLPVEVTVCFGVTAMETNDRVFLLLIMYSEIKEMQFYSWASFACRVK